MYTYMIEKQMDFYVEKYSDEGAYTTTETVTYPVYLMHSTPFHPDEFTEICNKAKEEISEFWGDEKAVNYKLISHLISKYGFFKLPVQGEFTYRFWK